MEQVNQTKKDKIRGLFAGKLFPANLHHTQMFNRCRIYGCRPLLVSLIITKNFKEKDATFWLLLLRVSVVNVKR